jgi:hypothetical protein
VEFPCHFTLIHAKGFASKEDIFDTVGCLTRISFYLLQALFALNEEYYFGDKGALQAVSHFQKQPTHFPIRLQAILAAPGNRASKLEKYAPFASASLGKRSRI